MKTLLFSTIMMLGLTSISAQVASTSSKNELVPTKKYEKTATVKKDAAKKKYYSSLKRIMKATNEKKQVVAVKG